MDVLNYASAADRICQLEEELKQARAERDAVTKRNVELEQAYAEHIAREKHQEYTKRTINLQMNQQIMPYAEFIEGFLGALIKYQPSKIGMVLPVNKGSVTEFHGNVTGGDKAAMAYHMVSNAIMNEVYSNAAKIVAEAEAQGGS